MPRPLQWTVLSLGAVLLALVLWYLFVFDWNDLKDHVTTAVGERTHRDFSVGDLDVDLSLTPRVRLERVRLENAEWSGDPQMVEIERLDFTLKLLPLLRGRVVLPELTLIRPRLVLERSARGEPNWDFAADPAGEVATEAAVPEERGEFPIVGRLIIHEGQVVYRDPQRNIDVESGVSTAVGLNPPGTEQVRLDGKGQFEGFPFTIEVTGASLLALREAEDPYPFHVRTAIGKTRLRVEGTAEDPLRAEGLDLRMALEGENLAEVFPVFGIPLPPTRPYAIAGALTREGKAWRFTDFAGHVGASDLAGNLTLDLAPDRPLLRAELISDQLHLTELAGFFGVRPDGKRPDKGRLIPDVPINTARLRAMNMEVDFRGNRVIAARVPAQRVTYHLRLRDGRLAFAPLEFRVAEGTLAGEIVLDGRQDPPQLSADLRVQQMKLGRFLPKLEAAGVAYGTFGGRFRLKGRGASLHRIMAGSDGGLWLSMSGGAVDEVVIAAVGLDVPDLLRLMGEEKTPVPLRCSVLAFDLDDGVMETSAVVVDTEKSTLLGEGTIDLRTERLDLTLTARAKEPSVLTLGGAIEIGGRLRRPELGLDLSGVAGQAGAAAALAALATPLAAILPFLDPGTGKDANCSALFAQGQRETAPAN